MNKSPKIPKEYHCEDCDYITFVLKDFNKHLHTSKHLNRTKLNNLEQKIPQDYMCKNCNKCYKARNSLWYHQQKCISNNIQNKQLSELDKDELILQLLKQNAELIKGQQDMMIKLTENGIHNTNNSNKYER